MMTWRRLRGRLRGDRGDAIVWGILIILIALVLSGVVLDGGNAMAAKLRAWDIAQEAARAGANQLDLTELREHGLIRLDPAAAQVAADQYLSAAGVSGTASATATQVTVTVTRRESTLLLRAIGVTTIPVTATAHATPVTGP